MLYDIKLHFYVCSILILLGIIYFFHQIDDTLTQHFKQFKTSKNQQCPLLKEPLAMATLSRMRIPKCKLMLEYRLCSMVNAENYWPVNQIDNTCADYFDPKLRYLNLGCFRDSPDDRLLKEFHYNFSTTNGPEFCVQNCLRAGFPLAGVEFGVECFCGGNSPEINEETIFSDSRIDDSHCRERVCPGNSSQFCGGFNAIQIFRTGVKGKFEQNLPKFHQINGQQGQSNVKILFLFQFNGRNSRQIRRLFRMLFTPAHLYLIHVDIRQQYLHREMQQIQRELGAKGYKNFRVLQWRMATIWGGTSLLELFLTAISETFGDLDPEWRQWDFVVNLSEADMPLLSIEELEANLAAAQGKSFLSSHGYNPASFLKKQGFNFHFIECERRMWRVANRPNFPRNIRLDGGSDWLVVHRDLAEYALSPNGLAPQLRLLFTSILLPLESFFHTLALNSANFCRQIIHRNLRFTNWRRKQGCRCVALKSVVDWCGCSPLALRGDEASRRIPLQICQEKSHFFGRKFDSHLHNRPIAFVERQALRFRPELIPEQTASFDSTWINIFHAETPNDSPFASKLPLLNSIMDLLLHWELAKAINFECSFRRLLQIHVYKANSSSMQMQSVFRIEVECKGQTSVEIEILLTQIHRHRIMVDDENGDGIQWALAGIGTEGNGDGIIVDWGLGFDVKEEIFRTNPPIIHNEADEIFTLNWQWTMLGQPISNWTSPAVHLELYGPSGGNGEGWRIEANHSIGPYDSIFGGQFVQIQMPKSANPGTWVATLFTSNGRERIKLIEATFPIFPHDQMDSRDTFLIVDQLLRRHFQLEGICIISSMEETEFPSQFPILSECHQNPWSSVFPDPKSKFPF